MTAGQMGRVMQHVLPSCGCILKALHGVPEYHQLRLFTMKAAWQPWTDARMLQVAKLAAASPDSKDFA